MSVSDVRLSAVTRGERHLTIDAINGATRHVGGWVDDVNFFSNLSVALRCIIPSTGAIALARAMNEMDLRIDAHELDELDRASANGKTDLVVSLNISFVHDEPDLRRHILACQVRGKRNRRVQSVAKIAPE